LYFAFLKLTWKKVNYVLPFYWGNCLVSMMTGSFAWFLHRHVGTLQALTRSYRKMIPILGKVD